MMRGPAIANSNVRDQLVPACGIVPTVRNLFSGEQETRASMLRYIHLGQGRESPE
jgi:hypothetical protein